MFSLVLQHCCYVVVCRFVRSLMAFVCQEIKGLLTYLLTYLPPGPEYQCSVSGINTLLLSQGQYWIEYLYLLLATPPYMAAANLVVITNGGGCALTGTADIDQ